MHKEVVKVDPGINQDLIIRRSREAIIVFKFFNEDGSDYLIEDDFEFNLKSDDKKQAFDILQFTPADALPIVDNTISVMFDEDNSNIDRRTCYYELKNITSKQNWYQGKITILTGESPEHTTTGVNGTIDLGEKIIHTTMTLGGSMTVAQIMAAIQTASLAELQALADLLDPLLTGGGGGVPALAVLYDDGTEVLYDDATNVLYDS